MENAEEIFQFLEEFSKRKPKTIPQELNDYLVYVARTGDPVYQWSLVKSLFKEKLLNVITDFHESTPSVDIPPCPNVDPFNYDIMKNSLLERLDTFTSAPFTVQRLCELLTCPRKQYNRVDKFMRAIEKNILVVSTREPGLQRQHEAENGEPIEALVNGSDNNSEYNVDVEMEDMSWKETGESRQESEPQPSSSDAHISVDDLEARLQAKQDELASHDKQATQYESVTPPELNVVENSDEQNEPKPEISVASVSANDDKENTVIVSELNNEQKIDVEMNDNNTTPPRALIIPDIKVDDAEMTEQKLHEQAQIPENIETETKDVVEPVHCEKSSDENSSDVSTKDESETKNISETFSSSEESSSSSENIDGNSNSPKQVIEEEKTIPTVENKDSKDPEPTISESNLIQSENYSITDVNSEIPQQTEPVKTQENSENINAPLSKFQEEEEESKKEELVDVPLNTETPES